MSGERVIVRSYGDKPLARIVWDVRDGRILITDEVPYHRLKEGMSAPAPIGFPPGDVFFYEPVLFDEIQEKYDKNKTIDWSKLRRYR